MSTGQQATLWCSDCEIHHRWGEHIDECDKVVAVLGDDNTYPCVLERGHPGRCQPDYEAI